MYLHGRFRPSSLRVYLLYAKLTRIPLLGHVIHLIADNYFLHGHSGYFLNYNEAKAIVKKAKIIALSPCSCRQINKKCDTPVMTELLIASGGGLPVAAEGNDLKLISVAEALDILDICHQKKLIPTIQKCHGTYYAICNCCDCCCVPLILLRKYNIKSALLRDKTVIEAIKNELDKPATAVKIVS